MENYLGGQIGELFASLAFAGAVIALISFFRADSLDGKEKKSWEKLGIGGFSTHILGILGMIGTLFYLIYTHQYQYHYVWSHSSNELPIEYMISCFWEGQEGSFLLWCFWHAVLGGIVMFSGGTWRNMVMAVIASIELILSSMILGIYLSPETVEKIFYVLAIIPGLYIAYRLSQQRNSLTLKGNYHIAALFVMVATVVLTIRDISGFYGQWSFANTFENFDNAAFSLFVLVIIGFGVYTINYINRAAKSQKYPLGDILAGVTILAIGVVAMMFEPGVWKIGSSPFITLKNALPDAEVFQTDPNFIPTNGSGLNPLLQNYWMVIHPPTLFLGFASTAIPFAFVMAGLIKGKYHEWIKAAMPWNTFSIMILGVGIIMGGYWAYETLNFGGYWNWDPVENSSFVPWLCGVASLHSMLIYQRKKSYLKLSMILIVSTFLLVLYSTFLTRSGILGDTSVHTFVDLGLSGQLLVLCFIYFAWVLIAFMLRWNKIPQKPDEGKVWSAEFMLFLGVLIFVFSGLEIMLSTSLPVINKILGTSLAPPANIQLFYYQWNVWFAIGFGIVSGMGQFLWWRIKQKASVANALYYPFLTAMLAGCAILIFRLFYEMEFAFDSTFEKIVAPVADSNFLAKAVAYIRFYVISFADELLLFSSLFAVMANGHVLIHLLRKNRKGLKVMGGTVVHIGFGLMLLGMLFSSGYDEVISKNLTPEQLATMPEAERVDNVLLAKNQPRQIRNYLVTYTGVKHAQGPVKDIDILEKWEDGFKVSFKDATGDRFAMALPWTDAFIANREATTSEAEKIEPVADHTTSRDAASSEVDVAYVEEFLNNNLEVLRPPRINNRKLYGLKFASMEDTSKSFVLYPEAEPSGNGDNSIIAHPSRKIYANRDIYVFVSGASADEDTRPEYRYHELQLSVGDTASIGNTLLYLAGIRELSDRPDLKQYQIAAAANIVAFARQDTFFANPVYTIDRENRPGMVEASIKPLHLDFAFVDIDPKEGIIRIQVQEQTNPFADQVIIKAIQKPYINLLWLGTFILAAGFMISIYRRVQENNKRKS